MKIAIDAQTIGRRRGGDETYWRNLLSRYGAFRPRDEFLPLYTHSEAEPFFRELAGRFSPRRLPFRSPFLRVPVGAPWRLWREPVDLYHALYVGVRVGGAKLVITVQDLSFEYYPETFPVSRARFLKLTRWATRRADLVLAISENTRRDLIVRYRLPEHRVRVTPLAADQRFAPVPPGPEREAMLRRYGLPPRYVLAMGENHPRKNIPRLAAAFEQARRCPGFDATLVLTGHKTPGPVRGGTPVLRTGYVPEEDLPALYSGALAFVYPSLYEGFGLPVLEAMQCGAPVICSRASSLPEVGGDAPCYVDPLNTAEIAEALVRVTAESALRQSMREKGLEQARRFSWERTARQTLQAYEDVLRCGRS